MPEDQILSTDRLKELLGKIDPGVLQQIMPLTGGVITMMFTDIVDSTKVKAEVGDQHYFEALKRYNELVRERVLVHNGRELKTIGDAFLVGFAVPADAVTCASEIQQRLAASPIQTDSGPLKVRIGLHTGTPKVYRDPISNLIDLVGTDVDKAARIEGLARRGQVLISEETKTLAKPKEAFDWGPWELKGLGRHRVFEVLWPEKEPERPVGHPWLTPIRFLTKFVGREKELAEIVDAILNHRLVTLKGIGGIGKTRLADEVAARVSQEFEDGVFFIELANIQDSQGSVVSDLVAKLEVKTAGFSDETTALQETLRNRRALLVLENFEAVISAGRFIATLLKQCPGIHILVTSRRPLDVEGEQQIEVPPMGAPTAPSAVTLELPVQLESYKLFRERARLQKPNWDVSPAEVPLVAEILELTDGIPLAIELAAAWVDKITLSELRDGLKKNRLEYLSIGPRFEDKRPASIQTCIDWSYNILSPQEQALLAMLSVFAEGFFAGDVAQVCQVEKASALLDSLQRQSLLVWEESLGKTRYRMLPTLQEYGARKLGNLAEGLRLRHTQHFLELLELADNQIRGKEQMLGIARITADIDNIRAGMDTAIQERDHQMVVRYSQAFATYLSMKGRFEELIMRNRQGLLAAEELKDFQLIASFQNNLGIAYRNLPTGDQGENLKIAIACYEATLRVYTERDFPVQWAMTQNNLGIAYADLPTGERGENLKKAVACYEAALRVYTGQDFPLDWAMTQNNLGSAYANLPTGDRGENLKKAIACYEAALRVRTEQDFPLDWAMTQNNLGIAYRNLPTGDRGENLKKAIACYEAALRVRTEQDFPVQWAMTLMNLGFIYQNLPTGDREANLQKAIACFEMALRAHEATGLVEEADRVKRRLVLLRQQP